MSNQSIRETGEKYIMNTYGRFPVAMVRGKKSRLYDADGNEYIDFLGGIAVTLFGHSDEGLIKAINDQTKKLLHCSNYYWIEPQNDLARQLCLNSCLDKVFFCNSGAEANEGAIKLARKYSAEHYTPKRHKILTFQKSFHGRTLATMTATGQEHFHEDFLPLMEGFDYVEFNDMDSLMGKMDDTVCAILFEPIQGEGGVHPMEAEFAHQMASYAKEHDILLIADEVQTGIGRTGELFAYETLGIKPDIMTLAKALGGGVPIGAFLARDEVAKALVPGDHGSTFGGNPLATAAASYVVQRLITPGVMEEVRITAAYFRSSLEAIASQDPGKRQVRGKGLMLALEIGQDSKAVMQKLFEAGLLCSTAGKTSLRFLPALNITKEEIDGGMVVLAQVLEALSDEGGQADG